MGLGAQLTLWPIELVDGLVARGFYVIRYDNRDIGRSTWLDEAGVPDIGKALATGEIPSAPYLLADMAGDAAGLLEALGIESAHIVGASMGGMIAQSLAIRHPDRVRTLVSIMSTTGAPDVGAPDDEVVSALFLAAPPRNRDEAMDAAVAGWKLIGSPGFPFHEDRIRAEAAISFDRGNNPAGTARQLLAIVASPDRTSDLRNLRCPTLVIHGEADCLINPSGGKATAEAVPGAVLWTIAGMGHDLPVEIADEMTGRIAAHCLGV
jgi:pimeloyl-ACP methyl ester carboxylesterase